MVVDLQCAARRYLARKKADGLRKQKAAITIQRYYRGHLARKQYRKELKKVVVCQNSVRRFLARRQLKALKTEARSIDHIKQLNKGLENKIISLQQRIEKMSKDHNQNKNLASDYKALKIEYDGLKSLEAQFKAATARIVELESSKKVLEGKLASEMEEKVDLVNTKSQLEESLKTLRTERELAAKKFSDIVDEMQIIRAQKEELEKGKLEAARMEQEREQEQQAYQQLLRKFHDAESKIVVLEQFS